MSRRDEESIHITVVHFLQVSLPDGSVFFHPPNGGSRNLLEAKKLKRMGTMPGVPDLFILWDGKLICIELKAPGAYLSKAQKEMKAKLERAGAIYAPVCRSVDDVKAFLEPLLPMRGR